MDITKLVKFNKLVTDAQAELISSDLVGVKHASSFYYPDDNQYIMNVSSSTSVLEVVITRSDECCAMTNIELRDSTFNDKDTEMVRRIIETIVPQIIEAGELK